MSHRNRMLQPMITASIARPRPGLTGTAAIEQLADDMRIAGARNGNVTRDELGLIGWTPNQLDTYGERARNKATTLSGAA